MTKTDTRESRRMSAYARQPRSDVTLLKSRQLSGTINGRPMKSRALGNTHLMNLRFSHFVPLALAALMAACAWMIFGFAPREVTMGDVQRIVYLHVAVAWCGLAACAATGIMSGVYMARRNPLWDQWSQASGEIGWLCTTLTLATGSLWAHKAWNTWWTWEPRLTASLILWLVITGYFLVRASVKDSERRAQMSAMLAMLALADIPMVIMATRWFRGIHPITPQMDPNMRLVLLTSIVSFTTLFVYLTALRQRNLALAARIAELEDHAEIMSWLNNRERNRNDHTGNSVRIGWRVGSRLRELAGHSKPPPVSTATCAGDSGE